MQKGAVVAYFEALPWNLARQTKEKDELLYLSRRAGFWAEIWIRDFPNTNQCYPTDPDVRCEELETGTSIMRSRSANHPTAMFGSLFRAEFRTPDHVWYDAG
jgi:hypothetical protein